MLLKIQQESTAFAKIGMKQHKNIYFSSCLQFLLNKLRSSCIFLSELWKICLIQNPDTPSKESLAKTRTSGNENMQIPGVAWGGMVRLGID